MVPPTSRDNRNLKRYLAPGEMVEHACRRHPLVLMKPVLVWVLGSILAVLGAAWLSQLTGIYAVDLAGLWVVAALSLVAFYRYLRWYRERYVFTNQRVLLLKGILAVRVSAVSLARVTETSFTRSIWGRLLGYGELRLDSPGEQLGLATLRYLPRPNEVYRLVSSLLYPSRNHDYPATVMDPSEQDTGELPPVRP